MHSTFSAPLPGWVFYPQQQQQQQLQPRLLENSNGSRELHDQRPRDPRQRQRTDSGSNIKNMLQLNPNMEQTDSEHEHQNSLQSNVADTIHSEQQLQQQPSCKGAQLLHPLPPGSDWEKLQQRLSELRVALEQQHQAGAAQQEQVRMHDA